MALTEKHRSSIYRSLVPILGEEEAQALVGQFPARDQDEPATKADLALTKADLRTEMADLRTEMAGLRVEMHQMKSSLMVTLIGAMTAQTAILGLVFTLSS